MAMSKLNLIFKCFIALLSIVIIIITIRTFTFNVRKIEKSKCTPLDTDFIKADQNLIGRFQNALKFKTVSTNKGDAKIKPELQAELTNIREYIIRTYTSIHSSPLVKYEVVANYSILYTLKGSDPSLKPYLLMAHTDVVPVPDQEKWEAPAFEGTIKDGFIYGRGTIDAKQIVFGILEALEFLLRRGFAPKRSFYLAFGHDEEVTGIDGAFAVSQTLTKRGIEFEFVLDEGLTIVSKVVPGTVKPVAIVGTSEKGWLSLKLSVNASGGHSSMPEPESCIGILACAVARLEGNPQPNMFGTGPERETMEHLAPDMNLPMRMIMSNLWLFGPIVSSIMARKPSTNACIRTTTAVTVFNAGIKDNVIPTEASAFVNHRIHPGQTLEEVIDFDRKIINDERIQIDVLSYKEPHPISPTCDECFGYQTIKTSILQVWQDKDVVVVPGLMIGNTDTAHYLHLSKNVYRFSPTYMFPDDLKRFHGINERISVKNYEEAVNFYYHVISNADSVNLEAKHEHGGEL